MHVIPRFDGVALLPPATVKADMTALAEQAAQLAAALKGA
jgi:histidine triad (HIT) family protein